MIARCQPCYFFLPSLSVPLIFLPPAVHVQDGTDGAGGFGVSLSTVLAKRISGYEREFHHHRKEIAHVIIAQNYPPTKKRSCRTYPESGAGTVEYVIVLIVAVVIGAGLLGFDFTSVVSANKMFGNCQSLSKVSLGSNWKWVIYDDGEGTNSYLPAPSSKYISGADGKWYSISTGKGYAPQDIPNNTGDTYVASKRLLSK